MMEFSSLCFGFSDFMGINLCETSVFSLQIYPVIFYMFKYILFVIDASVFKVFPVRMVGFLSVGMHLTENHNVTKSGLETRSSF